jgi:hypothetical protein
LLTTISGVQGSLGVAELLLADPLSGGSHIALALFGSFVARPEGLGLLPTFSLIAALNAAVGAFKAAVVLSARKKSLMLSSSLVANYLKFATLAHPVLYSLAFFYSWRLLAGLRDTFVPEVPATTAVDAQPLVVQPQQSPETVFFAGEGRRAVELTNCSCCVTNYTQ